MSRSRSSFEIEGAVATAAALKTRARRDGGSERVEAAHAAGVPLVSFGAAPDVVAPPPPAHVAVPPESVRTPRPLRPSDRASEDEGAPTQASPPKLPDLSAVVSPVVR